MDDILVNYDEVDTAICDFDCVRDDPQHAQSDTWSLLESLLAHFAYCGRDPELDPVGLCGEPKELLPSLDKVFPEPLDAGGRVWKAKLQKLFDLLAELVAPGGKMKEKPGHEGASALRLSFDTCKSSESIT